MFITLRIQGYHVISECLCVHKELNIKMDLLIFLCIQYIASSLLALRLKTDNLIMGPTAIFSMHFLARAFIWNVFAAFHNIIQVFK